ncbi:hypothetical protein ACJMK2_000702 [Sinanodonta woodiana]|uniref:Uncharacterized protein n=1 Tax=Sinanodonta woodiana TaxID=1069815 RepID=A0ABD3XQ29_SINWO
MIELCVKCLLEVRPLLEAILCITRDTDRTAVKNKTNLDFTCHDCTEAETSGMPAASSTMDGSLDKGKVRLLLGGTNWGLNWPRVST